MEIIADLVYDTWGQFKESVYKDLCGSTFYPGKFIYRGQSGTELKLRSTFDRYFPDVPQKKRKEIFEKLLSSFKNECDFRIPEICQMDDDSLLAFARHHGLPTRLLDWSRSIYVAAFFACNRYECVDQADSVVIYALNTQSQLIDEELGLKVIRPADRNNYRQFYQQGLYTLLNTYHDTIEDYLLDAQKRCQQIDEPVLYKILLPVSECVEALIDLQFMNINFSALYGDADGYAQDAVLRYKLTEIAN